MDKRSGSGLALEAVRRALALTDGMFPVELGPGTPHLVRVTVGLVARCVTSTQTCTHLAELGRRGDLMVCARTLYEHTVMLAWLLGDDGEQRMLLWQRYCDEQTLKFDDERARLGADTVVPAATRAAMAAATRELGNSRMPGLPERAAQADQEWADRLGLDPEHRSSWSLRHIYSVVFRVGSAMAHPTVAGLGLVTEKRTDGITISIEPPGRADEALLPVPVLIGTTLAMSSSVFQKPAAHEINDYLEWLLTAMPEAD